MALRLNFEEEGPRQIADVALPSRMHFMYSEAFRIFSKALAEYVDGHVLGRSFLIAGNRGAGKTTLVLRTVAEHYEATLKRLADAAPNKLTTNRRAAAITESLIAERLAAEKLAAGSPERRVAELRVRDLENELTEQQRAGSVALEALQRRRRPLLVKLHGPSLLADHLPGPGSGEVPKATTPSTNGPPPGKGEEKSQSGGSSSAAAKVDGAATTNAQTAKPSELAHAALVQITIGLYRALSDEFAECFARQVRGSPDLERLELAAQLRLDLDQGADPAVLRSYWARIGSLRHGVSWSREITEAAGLTDQGLREILALVTAGQAFQVCSGAVSYTESRKNLRSAEAIREGKTGVDFRDLANRVAGLTLGGLVGWGIAQGAGAPERPAPGWAPPSSAAFR
jgi:hypothetical protein